MYEKIKKMRQEGKVPLVELTPAARVPDRQNQPTGRPRKYPPGERGGGIAYRYVGRRGKNRPQCMAKGCEKFLRMHQPAACSEVCESRIINDAIQRLKLCRVSAEELLKLYAD